MNLNGKDIILQPFTTDDVKNAANDFATNKQWESGFFDVTKQGGGDFGGRGYSGGGNGGSGGGTSSGGNYGGGDHQLTDEEQREKDIEDWLRNHQQSETKNSKSKILLLAAIAIGIYSIIK